MSDSGLVKISGNSYLFTADVTVGVYFNEHDRTALLIDSGSNEGTARRILHLIYERGSYLTAMLITHGHDAQTGGLHYLKREYRNIPIYATFWSAQFIQYPILDSWLSGNYPGTHKADIQASHTITDFIEDRDHRLELAGTVHSIVSLPGHLPGMVGIITPDGVMYCGDALFGKDTLAKQQLIYYTNIRSAKETLDRIGSSTCNAYVLARGGKYEDVKWLIHQHRQRMDEMYEMILHAVRDEPQSLESIVRHMMHRLQLKSVSGQFKLANAVVRAYLAELIADCKLRVSIKDGTQVYEDYHLPVQMAEKLSYWRS